MGICLLIVDLIFEINQIPTLVQGTGKGGGGGGGGGGDNANNHSHNTQEVHYIEALALQAVIDPN